MGKSKAGLLLITVLFLLITACDKNEQAESTNIRQTEQVMNKIVWAEGEDDLTLRPLTEKAVRDAQEQLNVILPGAYINILKEKNGGYIEPASYPKAVPTAWAEDHIQIDHIKGIGEAKGILESRYLIQEWGLQESIVLISGDGHTWVALDYRKTDKEPPVNLY